MRGGGLTGLVCEQDFLVRGGGIIFLEGPKRVDDPGTGNGEDKRPRLMPPRLAPSSEGPVKLPVWLTEVGILSEHNRILPLLYSTSTELNDHSRVPKAQIRQKTG